jgi:Cof subfamily protein (haloacid dehalogenase superfamily)
VTRPDLVASDLDGTLLGSDGKVSARTAAAISAVEAAGATFVMVTGRPPRWMSDVSDQAGHRGLAICANGAVLYDLHTEEVVTTHLLAEEPATEVVRSLREALPRIVFAAERADLTFGVEPGYRAVLESQVSDRALAEELVRGGVVKLMARVEGMSSDDLLHAAAAVGGATFTHSSTDGLIEISASGVTKATGLAALAEERGIGPDGVLAFGDMPNDLPLLTWAGHGVAVANAHPDVLAAADEVTGRNDEDGVAQVIERWF